MIIINGNKELIANPNNKLNKLVSSYETAGKYKKYIDMLILKPN